MSQQQQEPPTRYQHARYFIDGGLERVDMLEREADQHGIEGGGQTWELFRPCLDKARRTASLVGGAHL